MARRQTIAPDINDLIPAEGEIVGIARSALHEAIAHPLEFPPQPVFEHLFRGRDASCVIPLISEDLLCTSHGFSLMPEMMP